VKGGPHEGVGIGLGKGALMRGKGKHGGGKLGSLSVKTHRLGQKSRKGVSNQIEASKWVAQNQLTRVRVHKSF